MHTMVYGEYVLSPQVELANKLTKLLPPSLNNVFLTNSGTEATEGALKLAKRYTGRFELITFKDTYHGSTHGALSVMGNETFKNSFRPLLPGVSILNYNHTAELQKITQKTAAVIVEGIQGEAGYKTPCTAWMQALRARCSETGTLLIFDEIQTGMGRTGKMFSFEHYNIVPDIVLLAKGLGGGLPIGAFISSGDVMQCLKSNPVLGHITTFGGNPVCAAAAVAVLDVIESENLLQRVSELETILLEELQHKDILSKYGHGLMLAADLGSFERNKRAIDAGIELGVITDWFLFNDRCMRICPPLTITNQELRDAIKLVIQAIEISK
jgi:acetylornithine/succinyldiaminopimelate/putrescine aminotransferase